MWIPTIYGAKRLGYLMAKQHETNKQQTIHCMHVSLELPILVKMYSWMSRNRSEYGDCFKSREFWNVGVVVVIVITYLRGIVHSR
ncbi:hypothetical protein BDV39DRAFT_178204 [Aspergillus sergii]|uniref:Transmembrane protein n=1 Tax=Aspergillus sergii TaxID=1034303 RepID=A0A5N6WXU0_9EURO|nr:hypothetical protein BDV39DRAFT_178204 [Aspergillus sergii]